MQTLIIFIKSSERLRSPNPSRNSLDIEKDEGISDEEDTAELKLQLELNEQVRYDLFVIYLKRFSSHSLHFLF